MKEWQRKWLKKINRRSEEMIIKKIGFIGLGAMGFPMAKRLVNAGYEVHTATHSNKSASLEKTKQLKDMGAIIEDNFADVAKGMDLIITMLPADKEVKGVLLEKAFYDNVGENTILLDMTSCSPEAIMEVENEYLKKGIKVIDGPVSGGVSGAENGKLTIFGGGESEVIDSISDVFNVLASTVHHVGKVGQGKALKAINQMMVAINMMSVIEGFSIANKRGIDFDVMFNVIKESSGNSYAFERKFNNLVEEKFEGGFKLSLMRKDLMIALNSVENTPLPFANLLYDFFLMGKEYDDFDYSVISKLFMDGN